MYRFQLIIVVAGIFFNSLVFAQWELNKLPGGNIVETIVIDEVVDSDTIRGVWAVNKNSGVFWFPWDGSDWGEYQEYDAYYAWFMGGDVMVMQDTLFALAVTMQGHHYYYYNNNNGSWDDWGSGFIENNYFQYADAAFFDVPGDTVTPKPDHFLLSTWQPWKPDSYGADDYQLGLYLVHDGTAPAFNEDPITTGISTIGKAYNRIYRDLDAGNIFYTWCSAGEGSEAGFHKVTITGSHPYYTSTLADDFSVTNIELLGVSAFYQYMEGDTIHQYLYATTANTSHEESVNVWYRNSKDGSLSASEWGGAGIMTTFSLSGYGGR